MPEIIVKFLNGDLMCLENIQNIQNIQNIKNILIEELKTYETYDRYIHPSQLDLIYDKDNNIYNAFIHPKRRVVLSDYSFINNDEFEQDDEFDPFEIPKTDIYRECKNDSIISRLIRLNHEIPKELFSNPHPLAVDWIINFGVKREFLPRSIYENPSEQIIDFLIDKRNIKTFYNNPNPKAIYELKEENIKDILYETYTTKEMKEYAIQKLREHMSEEDLEEFLYDIDVMEYRRTDPYASNYYCGNPKHYLHKWFVKAVVRRDFSLIIERLEKCKYNKYNEYEETKYIDRRGKPILAHMKLDNIYNRLVSISDSDELAEWLCSHIDELHNLCANPHPRIVQYFLDHPNQIYWRSWVTNPNPCTVSIEMSEKDFESIFMYNGNWRSNEKQYFLTVDPQPFHMVNILDRLNTMDNRNQYSINLSTILESFSKTNEIDLVFDE